MGEVLEARGKKEEEEPQNANIYVHRIRIVIEVGGVPRFEFYIPKSHEQEFKKFMELCKQDKLSASRVIVRLIRTWVHEHSPGNVQRTLVETDIVPPYEYDLFPVERRRQLMEDLLDTIKKNPDVPIRDIAAAFAVGTGLREETVISYIQTLKRARKLRRTY